MAFVGSTTPPAAVPRTNPTQSVAFAGSATPSTRKPYSVTDINNYERVAPGTWEYINGIPVYSNREENTGEWANRQSLWDQVYLGSKPPAPSAAPAPAPAPAGGGNAAGGQTTGGAAKPVGAPASVGAPGLSDGGDSMAALSSVAAGEGLREGFMREGWAAPGAVELQVPGGGRGPASSRALAQLVSGRGRAY